MISFTSSRLACLLLLVGTPTFGAAQEMQPLPKSGSTSVTGYYQFSLLQAIDMGDLVVKI